MMVSTDVKPVDSATLRATVRKKPRENGSKRSLSLDQRYAGFMGGAEENGTGFVQRSRSITRTNIAPKSTFLQQLRQRRAGANSSTSISSGNSETSAEIARQTHLIRSFNEVKNEIILHSPEAQILAEVDRSKIFRAQVRRAVMENKIFACNPRYPAIRKALERRGWVEKIDFDFTSTGHSSRTTLICNDNFSTGDDEDDSDHAWMERILRNYPPDFIFKYWRDKLTWETLLPDQIVNQHMKSHFTTKVSITDRVQDSHWFSEKDVAFPAFPRCYRLAMEEEKAAFMVDFRLTACLSLMQWVVNTFEKEGQGGLVGSYGSPLCSLDFAIGQVNNYTSVRKHEDLDKKSQPHPNEVQWGLFLTRYTNAVYNRRRFMQDDPPINWMDKYAAVKKALVNVKMYWPQHVIDGMYNLWICKPGAMARGKGIVVMNQLDAILNNATDTHGQNWVVQKYIERPLLIFRTKFDIRQWLFVSEWRPLTVWFYKQCYLRFCSKPFNMKDFHESIHLCNNVVQSKYDICEHRDPALPAENMWDSLKFQNYLRDQGKVNLWEDKIYPGMKQSVVAVLRSAQNEMEDDYRRNTFEIFGADFMLSEDYTPWILEVNRSPCMEYTTEVTSKLCHQCLEDCIKVIIDRRENPEAGTGDFELIYQAEPSSLPFKSQDPNEEQLIIHGKAIRSRQPASVTPKPGSRTSSPKPPVTAPART